MYLTLYLRLYLRLIPGMIGMSVIKGLLKTLILSATLTVAYIPHVLGEINIPHPLQPHALEEVKIPHPLQPHALEEIKIPHPLQEYYRPVIDIAQYAIDQGNSSASNLIEGFIPLYPRALHQLSFIDIRFYNPNGTPVEGNIDVGFRQLLSKNIQLVGFYIGYDRFRSETRRYYSQLHAGFEYWVHHFFIGGNGYLPIGNKVYDNDASNLAVLVPTPIGYRYNIGFLQGKERVLPGVDAEIGYDITPSLTLYAGGYYFDHSDASSVLGPKVRGTYTFYRGDTHRLLGLFDRIRLEGLLSYDSVRGTTWLVGLRLRFGLSKHPNPSQGLARHMTDTVRRDLNVITEPFNLPSQFYRIDGRRARVDLVSSTSGRTVEGAVNAVDMPADIIGIIGPQTASDELTIGDRNLNITGGEYRFTVNGHPYRIPVVGSNGDLTSAGGDSNLFSLVDATGDHIITLQYLTFNTPDESGFALQTDGNAFGQITVDHIVSNNMPFSFDLITPNATGSFSFTHNVLDLQNSTAIDPLNNFIGVQIFLSNDSNQIKINQFSNNIIRIVNRSLLIGADDDYIALCFTGAGITLVTHGFLNNAVILSGNIGFVLGWETDSDMKITGDVRGNTFNLSNNEQGADGWEANQVLVMNGNFRNNIFTISNNGAAAFGWRILTSNIGTTINGNVSENTFMISGNQGPSVAVIEAGETIITGNIVRNKLVVIDSDGDGIAWRMTNDNIRIQGNIYENTFTASGNSGIGYGILIDDNLKVIGNVSENTFTILSNERFGYGIRIILSNTLVNGQISNNNFIIGKNDISDFGLTVDFLNANNTVTFNRIFTGNRFLINGTLTGEYGFQLDTNSGATINFNANTETNLRSLNNNVSRITILGTGTVNYNG